MKKIIILAISVFMVIALGVACSAPPTDSIAIDVPQADEDVANDPVSMENPDVVSIQLIGTVKAIDTADGMLVQIVADSPDAPNNDVAANITADTRIIAADGTPMDSSAIKVGEKVHAYVSPNMTRSIPPIAQAQSVVVALPANGLGAPTYVIASEVDEVDNGVGVLNQNKDTIITVTNETPITRMDGSAATLADIKADTQFFAWYDLVAQSYPAQATATKIVLI